MRTGNGWRHDKTLAVVTSCDAGQTAGELSEVRHGLFSLAMLDLLRTAQSTRSRLDLSDAFRIDLGRRMREIAVRAGLPSEQRPRLSSTGTANLVLLDGVASPATVLPPVSSNSVAVSSYVVCPDCGLRHELKDTFRCRVCGRDYLCLDHYDKTAKSCADCAAKAREEAERKAKAEAVDWNAKGDDFYFGRNGIAQDYAAAVKWYRKAAEQGNAAAQFSLGWMYAKGFGVAQDDTESGKWWRKAAEQGDANAQSNLGWMYQNGHGVVKDDAEAVKWFRKAAERGNATGQSNLGWMYANGFGVAQDYAEAVKWYRKAAEQGDEDAEEALKCLGNGANRSAAGSGRKRQAEEQAWKEADRNRPGAVMPVTVAGVSFNLRRIPAVGTQPALWMGETQVTQALWTAVMGSNPSRYAGDDQRPVERVSWNDCQAFLLKLNALDEVCRTGLEFRLPSAKEWEYACRAGSTGKYCRLADGTEITEKTLGRVAWFDRNSGNTTHPVGQKRPNALGLCDMHGNVWEWTQTRGFGGDRVRRGGSFFSAADSCTAGCKSYYCGEGWTLGFRLAASDKAASVG